MTHYLNTEFHGVPAGTALNVVSSYTDWHGSPILIVERVDGLPLPVCSGETASRTHVAAEFVSDKAPDGMTPAERADADRFAAQYVADRDAEETAKLAARKAPKLTARQSDAMARLGAYVGQTVQVLTSQYDANVAEAARRASVGTFNAAALRGLHAKGLIRIERAYWKGMTVTVLRAE